ncbi:MAG: maltokinase N-terminal cap-like domain-containing protein [Acidimicrobiales bacterium]
MKAEDLLSGIAPLLEPYIGRQRWAVADSAEMASVEKAELLDGFEPPTLWLLVRRHGDLYQLLIGLRPKDEPLDLGERDVLGVFAAAGKTWFAYDGLADADIVRHLAVTMGATGVEDAIVRPVGAEQSNSSVVLGQKVILKLFRRLQPGPNPDVEVTTGLDQVGFNHLASPLGLWSRGGYDLAVAQEFLAGGSEGWALALTSLRDLYASEEEDPAVAGGDFASEARRIGEMTARMHIALGKAFGVHPSSLSEWADAMVRQVDRLGLGADVRRRAEALARRVVVLQEVPSVRVHGDLHLGQVMRADAGWFVLDFEGEPARPVAERRLPWPAAKDVAGMVRSFAYAAAAVLHERESSEREALEGQARAWVQRNRQAFLGGYASVEGLEAVLPDGGPDSDAYRDLLAFFEFEKALYEVAYERAHRPDWEAIPLAAIERLGEG